MKFKLFKPVSQQNPNIFLLKGLNEKEDNKDLIFYKNISLCGDRVFDFNEMIECGQLAYDLAKKQLCTI